jgi:TetR/AcrR family transcriptional repressor of bet genes
MAKKGYEGASTAEIAEAAGLTTGLVHYHFESKLDILIAVIDELAARHRERLDRALAGAGGDPAKELDAFIDAHLATGRDAEPEALACWVMCSAEALRDERVRTRYAAMIVALSSMLTGIVKRGAKTKVFTARELGAATAAIISAIEGYYVVASIAPELIPRSSAARTTKKMARALLEKS